MKKKNDSTLLHAQYKQTLVTEKRWVLFYQLLIFTFLFSFWEIASRNHWIDPLIFSYPSKIGHLLVEKVSDGTIFTHLGVTVFETCHGIHYRYRSWHNPCCDPLVVTFFIKSSGSISRYFKCHAKSCSWSDINCWAWTRIHFNHRNGCHYFCHYHNNRGL